MANEIMTTEEQAPITCVCCGCIIEGEAIETADGPVCEDCRDFYYVECEHCHQLIHVDNSITARASWSSYATVCEDCAERDFVQCTDCEEYVDPNLITLSDAAHDICDRCEDDWCVCDNCGEVLPRDNAYWSERHEEWYCEDCRPDDDDGDEELDSYEYKPSPVFGTTDEHDGADYYEGDELVMGVELEMDHGQSVNRCVRDLREISDRIYCKHDGSLDDGIELVTHPGTLAWHMTRLPWKKLCQTGLDHGFKSHDAGTCGLHVHVGRHELGKNREARSSAIGKIILLMDRLWDELYCFSRRSSTRWCARTEVLYKLTDATSTNKALRLARNEANRDRYVALNLGNDDTIEFRLFRGSLKYTTVFATLQLVQNLCEFAMTHTVQDCIDAQWSDVQHFSEFSELNDYVADRFAGHEFPAKPKAVVLGSVAPHEFVVGDVICLNSIEYTIMGINAELDEAYLFVAESGRYQGNCHGLVADRHGATARLSDITDNAEFVRHLDPIPEEYKYHAPVDFDFRIGDRVTLNEFGRQVNPRHMSDLVGTIVEVNGVGADMEICIAFDGFTRGHNGPFLGSDRMDCWFLNAREIQHSPEPFALGDRVRLVDESLYDGSLDTGRVYRHGNRIGNVVIVDRDQCEVQWDGLDGNGNGHSSARNTWFVPNRWLRHVAHDAPAPVNRVTISETENPIVNTITTSTGTTFPFIRITPSDAHTFTLDTTGIARAVANTTSGSGSM